MLVNKKNVLGLFEGMGCGQIALKELGYNFTYYSSEIDKFCMKQTQYNFPDTIQLGDITEIDTSKLPKIDLLIGGSPCQGFSFAGKQLNFEDPRSKLFFEFVRIKNELQKINPDMLFLLENVNMKKQYMRVMSEQLGVFPVNINSNLVSAQNRNRWYWTNIKTKRIGFDDALWSDIPQPIDRKIFLKDVLQPESEIDKKYYLSDTAINRMLRKKYSDPKINPEKGGPINPKNNSGQCGFDSGTSLIGININSKAPTQRSATGRCLDERHNYQIIRLNKQGNKKADQDIICVAMRGRETVCLTPKRTDYGKQPYQQNRVYDPEGKMPALTAELEGRNNILSNYKLRRLTPIECSRLQTIPASYRWIVSDTQIYKMLGNGFTVEVIKHILSKMN